MSGPAGKHSNLFGRLLGGQAAAAPTCSEAAAPDVQETKPGWLQRLRSGLGKTSAHLSEGITGLFTKRKLDGETLADLEDLPDPVRYRHRDRPAHCRSISKGRFDKTIAPEEVRRALAGEIEKALATVAKPLVIDASKKPHVILMVGVNGTGKTTTIGKIAASLRGREKLSCWPPATRFALRRLIN